MPFADEEECAGKVARYFRRQGYRVFREVPFYLGWVDIVAVRGTTVVAIEVKITHRARCFRQARRHSLFANAVYVALPANLARATVGKSWEEASIGLIEIGRTVKIIRESCSLIAPIPGHTQRVLEHCLGENCGD